MEISTQAVLLPGPVEHAQVGFDLDSTNTSRSQMVIRFIGLIFGIMGAWNAKMTFHP